MQRRLIITLLLCGLVLMIGLWTMDRLAGHDPRDASMIASVGYLRDDANLDFEHISSLPFAAATDTFSAGYDPAAHWFRIRLTAGQPHQPVVLGVFPAFLDHVTLFASDDGLTWYQDESGDTVPVARKGWKLPGNGFVVHPATPENVYYLRVRTESTVQVFLTARPRGNELVQESQRMALHGMLFTLLGLAVIVSFVQSLYRPTLAHALLTASSLSYLVYAVLMLGYAVIAHPDWGVGHVAMVADAMYFVTAATSIAFHRHFLARMQPWKAALWFADALLVLTLIALAAYAAGFAPEAFKANSVLVLASVLGLSAMALSARESADMPLALVRVIYAAFAITSFGWMTVILGLAPASQINRFSIEVHGFLNVALVLSLVLSRWWFLERKQAATKARLQDAALRSAATARATELQDKLLNMLVHEVRNQLATIRISAEHTHDAADRAAAAKVVDTLERTISDCVRLAWLERGEWQPKSGEADLFTVVVEALAEAGDDDRIDVTMAEDAQPVLAHDGTMLRIALAHVVQEILRRSRPDARIEVVIERSQIEPDQNWRVVIAAESDSEQPISFDPYAPIEARGQGSAQRSHQTLAVARGIIELINGRLTLGYSRRKIECTLLLPARSTSA